MNAWMVNTMDVVYRPPRDYPSHYPGSTSRRAQSTNDEANRILQWNYDAASSDVPSPPLPEAPASAYTGSHGGAASVASRALGRFPDDAEPYLVRRVTTTTTTTTSSTPSTYDQHSSSPHQSVSGLSAGTVVGTLLGVAAGAAAGAALTLTAMRNDRSRAPHQEFDTTPPTFSRRATFPDPYPEHKERFVEVERTVEKIRYPEAYPALVDRRGPPPEYIARYRSSGPPRSKGLDDAILDDMRSRHSSRSHHTTRTRSEVAGNRRPLMLEDTEHRSHASSSKTSASKHPPIVQRSYTYDVPSDRESYASARSHHSSSTIKPGPTAASTHTVTRSKTGSRVNTHTHTLQAGGDASSPHVHPRGFARASSHTSARNVPLPYSTLGSSHVGWDDDADSVAPSDSISCVGSRRSGRSRH